MPVDEPSNGPQAQTLIASMNRKQKFCMALGFILIVLATAFPPWRYPVGALSPVYGFLFGSHLPLLAVSELCLEWLLILLVIGGLVLNFNERAGAAVEIKTAAAAGSPRKKHLLAWLTAIVAVLVLCVGLVSYQRKAKKPEAEIPIAWSPISIQAAGLSAFLERRKFGTTKSCTSSEFPRSLNIS